MWLRPRVSPVTRRGLDRLMGAILAALVVAVLLVPWSCWDVGTAHALGCENVVGIRVTLQGSVREVVPQMQIVAVLVPVVAGVLVWLGLGTHWPFRFRPTNKAQN
jgi:hypothetical protein